MKNDKRKAEFNQSKEAASKAPTDFSELKCVLADRGWCKDRLTITIEDAFCNIGVSFLNLKPYFELLIKAHEIFMDVNKSLSFKTLEEMIAISLFGRTNGCFIGAIRLASSGQITETWILLRACLENSLYAFYMAENPALVKIWTDRHESEGHKKKCKKAFTVKKLFTALNKKSHGIATETKSLYEQTIDWGAHPNERSLFINLENKREDSGFNFNVLNPDEIFLKSSLCSILLTVSTVFKIFTLVYPDSFEQPNLKIKMVNLNKGMIPLLHLVSDQLRAKE